MRKQAKNALFLLGPTQKFLVLASFYSLLLVFLMQCIEIYQEEHFTQACFFMTFFAGVTVILQACYVYSSRTTSRSTFMVFYLLSTFTLLIAWRINGLSHLPYSVYGYVLPFALKLINFVSLAWVDIRAGRQDGHTSHHLSAYEWQLMFIRMWLGFDLVPHFVEKLFAGAVIRADDVAAFQSLHVPYPFYFVILAGLCELAGCLSIGCGFITRLGAFCTFLYLLIATVMGHHLSLGFMWVDTGGGWEFPILWSALILTFSFFGGDRFSIDAALTRWFVLPRWLRFCMGVRSR